MNTLKSYAFKTKVNKANTILYISFKLLVRGEQEILQARNILLVPYSFQDSCKAEIHSITLRRNVAIPQSGTKTTTEFDTYRQTLMKK